MEKIKAPKHCSFHWRHKIPVAIRVGVDAEWNSEGVYREESRGRSDRSGESSLCNSLLFDWLMLSPKLLDVAEGLNYLHANYTVHGDLKGASTDLRSFKPC